MKKDIIVPLCALSLLIMGSASANEPSHTGLKICTVSNTVNACSMPVEAGEQIVKLRFANYSLPKGTQHLVCDYANTSVVINDIKDTQGDFRKSHSAIVTNANPPTAGKLALSLKHATSHEKINGIITLAVTGNTAADKHAINISNCREG